MNSLFNLTDYTVAEHAFFAIGCLLWVFTYFIVIHNIRKHQFLEIPVVAVCANFAWEFLWSFVFKTDMGELYVWGYRIWFALDCYIVYGLYKYGNKQIPDPLLSQPKFFKIATTLTLTSWFIMLFYYIKNYDEPISHMGAYSGYILNVMMSAMYITLFLRVNNPKSFSWLGAWFKGVGTILITIFCFLRFNDGFLLSMCVITGVLDVMYIYLLHRNKVPMIC